MKEQLLDYKSWKPVEPLLAALAWASTCSVKNITFGSFWLQGSDLTDPLTHVNSTKTEIHLPAKHCIYIIISVGKESRLFAGIMK